jgi:hypothetical protein
MTPDRIITGTGFWKKRARRTLTSLATDEPGWRMANHTGRRMQGRKCRAPEPPSHRRAKRRANLTYQKLVGDECLAESHRERAEDALARLVAVAFKAEHPEMFMSAPAPSSTPAAPPTADE